MSSIVEHPVAASAANTTGTAVSPYLEAARRAGQALVKAFPAYPNYWQLGHTFDTLNDYFPLFFDPKNASEFAEMVLGKFLNRQCRPWLSDDVQRDPWWYDDLGWWGVAALRAGGMQSVYGDRNARFFTGVAELSWQPFYRNAPNVWENAKWNDDWAEFAPRFDGGVWNYFFTPREIAGTPFTPGFPGGQDGIRCIQNTVTNGLYWMLMARLARARAEPKLREAADGVGKFFGDWFAVAKPDECLLNYFSKDHPDWAVVRERVATYGTFEADGKTYNRTWNYDPGLAWTGDQGLVLGALVDQMALVGRGTQKYKELLDIFRAIAAGVLGHLVDAKTLLLWPWAPYSGPDKGCPSGDCKDYLTGIGVFMRNVLYAYRQNGDTKLILDALAYPKVIEANADNVLKNPSKDDDFIGRTNDLATLLTAIRVLNPTG